MVGKPKTITEVLVHERRMSVEDKSRVAETSAKSGQDESEVLLNLLQMPRADVYAAMGALGQRPAIARLDDLPNWDLVLTDEGQPLFNPGLGRPSDHAVIYHSTEHAEWMQVMRTVPCFILATEAFANSRGLSALMNRCAQLGYGPLATLVAERPETLTAFYEFVDVRGARRRGTASSDDAPLHKLFDQICYTAFRRGASDIHLTSTFGRAFIKFRVHGLLEHYEDMSVDTLSSLMASAYNTLVERGSTKSGYNAGETQDGLIERSYPEGLIRFRYNHMPLAPSGVDHTLRIIPIGVEQKRKSMESLGYSEDQCEFLDRAFANRDGMILFAGTTGSGKSTTMANKLMEVAETRKGKKIRTIEEPVEYRIEGAYQAPVKRIKGDASDFLVMMRAALRSDPDILGVGEIRDIHTAELAIQAVRSGHLCVSSIHAESSLGVYDRLAGMGVPRADLGSINLVAGFVYQALVPVLCQHCKIPGREVLGDPSRQKLIRRLSAVADDWMRSLDGVFFARPGGCPKCHQRGVATRTVVAECHRPTPAMLESIRQQNPVRLYEMHRMQIAGRPEGDMTGRTSMEHAVHKMFQGIVCPSHVEDNFKFLDDLPPYRGS